MVGFGKDLKGFGRKSFPCIFLAFPTHFQERGTAQQFQAYAGPTPRRILKKLFGSRRPAAGAAKPLGSRQQAAGGRRQAAASSQQAGGSRQQAKGSRQHAACSMQQEGLYSHFFIFHVKHKGFSHLCVFFCVFLPLVF